MHYYGQTIDKASPRDKFKSSDWTPLITDEDLNSGREQIPQFNRSKVE